jgi:hypothetical protein
MVMLMDGLQVPMGIVPFIGRALFLLYSPTQQCVADVLSRARSCQQGTAHAADTDSSALRFTHQSFVN